MLIKKINKYTLSRLAATLSAFGLIIIASGLILPVSSKIDAVDATTPLGDSALTVSTDGGASVVLRVNSADGTFASSGDAASGNSTARFSVSTTNYTGYTLSLAPSLANEYADKLTQTIIKNQVATTYAIDSISGAVSGGAFDARYNNMWGIKPSKYNSAANSDYLPAPTSATILDATSAAASNDYTLDLGVRADYSKPAGAYSNTFVLVATANPIVYVAPVELSDGVENVKIMSGDTVVADLAATGEVMLTYGVDYRIVATPRDGYELGGISTTGGTLNGDIYRIEPGHAGKISVSANAIVNNIEPVTEPAAEPSTEPTQNNGD